MTGQDQRVSDGGQAQAGRDGAIYGDMSPDQMTEIMVSMAKQLSIFHADAMKIVDERLASFREEVIKTFVQPGRADPNAFRDPDFQYVLNEAQEAYARSGDEALRNTLMNLIARRSLEPKRNRIAVTLNDAVTKAPALTVNEFAELSLVYLVRYTQSPSVVSFNSLCENIRTQLMPFVPNVTREQSSYWHLVAQGCGTIEMGQINLYQALRHKYGGVMGRGFDRTQLESHLPADQKHVLDRHIIPCLHDQSKLQPNARQKSEFLEGAAISGLTTEQLSNVWALFASTILNQPDFIALLGGRVPSVQTLFDVWETTPLSHLHLNAIGIAIAHANAVQVVGFDADLKFWIK
jgi:hypothetical protein